MNKSRRMAALTARALATDGWTVLQLDLAGCGDSPGNFGEASWQTWIDDISQGWKWLQDHHAGPVVLWTMRAGSLLMADWLATVTAQPSCLVWQPVVKGRQYLRQLLRLRVASNKLAGNDESSVSELAAQLESGESVEVGGYLLSPAIAGGVDASELDWPRDYAGAVRILEVASANRREPSPGISRLASRLRENSVAASTTIVEGPAFWQTVEIETAPALIEATIRAANELPA